MSLPVVAALLDHALGWVALTSEVARALVSVHTASLVKHLAIRTHTAVGLAAGLGAGNVHVGAGPLTVRTHAPHFAIGAHICAKTCARRGYFNALWFLNNLNTSGVHQLSQKNDYSFKSCFNSKKN